MRRPPRTPPKDISAKYRVNNRIRASEVQVIDENGQAIGVMKLSEALALAYDKDLDLVEVAPTAKPPVCRIMDFGKFIYQEKRRQRESKKHTAEVKEISIRPATSDHDLEVKLRKAREFIEAGHKVRFKMRFRGREIVHSEEYKKIMLLVAEKLSDVAKMENPPKLQGRFMFMLVRPIK